MIFNVPGHIEMIRNGLPSPKNHYIVSRTHYPTLIVKTQTRRLNRGIYQIGSNYAVQRKRGAKGEPDIRIVMDKIWEELYAEYLCCYISEEDAMAEGGYKSAIEFEEVFRKLNPKWVGDRWAFEFHVIEVYTKEEQQKLERSLKHLHQGITEHIHPYVATKIEKIKKRC